MDYKEKYEMALEGIQEILGSGEDSIKMSRLQLRLQGIFPELRESEDERIRKEILCVIRQLDDNTTICGRNYDFQKWIAWLEKHSIDINKMVDDYANNKERGNEEFGKPVPCMIRAYRQGLNDAIHQKDFAPKEVIPRYNIGDVLCDKSCTTLSKEEQPNFEITDIRNGMYICDKCSFPISQQDEYELVAKRIEQKPWSEEDERMCQETIDWFEKKCFPYALENENPARESIKWLKSLNNRVHPQHKQEWSEDDERSKNAAISACKYMVDNFENSTKQYEDAIVWLEKQGEQEPIKENMGNLGGISTNWNKQ